MSVLNHMLALTMLAVMQLLVVLMAMVIARLEMRKQWNYALMDLIMTVMD